MARRSKMGRFEVWNQGSDAFKHTDLAYNWDQLDQMLGSPNQTALYGNGDDFNNPTNTAPTGPGQWLHPQDTTQISNLGNRTMYNIVRALDYNSVHLGSVIAWWRPSIAVPLPSGCVPADGASYTGADKHSYQAWGITTITVPDLRNKMILGAYETAQTDPPVALNRDDTVAVVPSTNNATDGPGIGAVGGTNVPRALAHTHGIGSYYQSAHDHNITSHVHSFSMVDHQHVWSATTGSVIPGNSNGAHISGGGTGHVSASFPNNNHQHSVSGLTAGILGGPPAGFTDGNAPVLTSQSTPALHGNSDYALATTEILPRYVGLLYIVKIRKPGPLHNTSFPVGT